VLQGSVCCQPTWWSLQPGSCHSCIDSEVRGPSADWRPYIFTALGAAEPTACAGMAASSAGTCCSLLLLLLVL
jgi:hypothetical protein